MISILMNTKLLRLTILALVFALTGADVMSQIQFGPGPQTGSFTSNRVRGYHFTAPVNFNICEVYVPNSMNNNMWHVEIVRFTNGAPPAFPGTTNAFVSLFYADSVNGNNPISCNVAVTSGDVIGIYGSRSTAVGTTMANSYDGANFVTTILGNNATLSRSGMQFPLNNQQMHDIWSEVNFSTGRIFGFHSCCPTPPKPQGPFNGPMSLCQGDTVTWWIPKDSIAEDYAWTVPAGDSILSIQGDTMITVAIGANSLGGQICVELEDTCTWSGDTCFNYTITEPVLADTIAGPKRVCQNNSAWYVIPPQAGAIQYEWTVTNGNVIDSSSANDSIEVQFASGVADICVRYRDNCAWSEDTCIQVNSSVQPNAANAGPDRTVCTGKIAKLNANVPNVGDGAWTVVSAPNGIEGTFNDTTINNATYTATEPGQHILRWTVSSEGCPSTEDEMIVTVAITPSADFTTADVCEGAPVSFQDQSQNNGATINSWLWDVDGDGVDNYVIQSPVHMYANEGSYSVRLIVNAQGCADTLYKIVDVNPEPDIDFEADNVCLNEVMSVQNNTTIPSGFITEWAFDFGDNSPVDSSFLNAYQPDHIYPFPGPYTINATAKSNKGCYNSASFNVRVHHLPEAKFSLENSCQYQVAVFKDESSVIASDIKTWEWNFGDGSSSVTKQNPKHQYDIGGFVQVHLEVTSSFGCYDDTLTDIEVYPTPVTEFNFTNKVCLGDILELNSVSTVEYGSLDKFEWVIDSVTFKTGESTTHLFDAVGVYPVTLTTTSDKECSHSTTKMIPVYDIPEADFNLTNICEGEEFRFDDTTYFTEPVKTYQWNFGDGSVLNNERNPLHTYSEFGEYDVTLFVESFRECTSTITHPIKVYEKLMPRFSAVPDSGCSPLEVEFVDSTKSESGVEWNRSWVFGDGQEREDTALNVYTNYTGKFNRYNVTLKVTTEEGCYSEKTMDSIVYVVPQPKALFSTNPDDVLSLTTKSPAAQFINESREANYYRWDFGDGETSRDHNPFHEWKGEGTYVVKLAARNIYNCTDTFRREVNIRHVNVPYIPSAFTPNGDGNNEVFRIEGLENLAEMSLEIYDRWGNLIYEEKGDQASWDGRDNQRKIVQQGVYFYRLLYIDSLGEEFELFGNVSVLGIE